MPRPKERLLSRQKIVEQAIELIDEVGSDEFSVHRLAKALNVKAPSIYYYYKDRDELLAAVCIGVLQEIRIPKRRSPEWKDSVLQNALAYFRAVRDHPNVAPLLLQRKWQFWAADRLDAALEQMQAGGISPGDGLAIVDCIEGLALSWLAFGHAPDGVGFGGDKLAYPTLREARQKQKYDESSYRRMIVAMLTGMEQLYASVAEDGVTAGR